MVDSTTASSTCGAPPTAAAAALTPAAGCWSQRLQTHDLDAHAAAQPGWELRYEQLSSGHFSGLVHHVQLPLARLVHEQTAVAVRQRGTFAEGHYGFAMPLLPLQPQEPAIFNGQRVLADDVMLGRNGSLDLCTPAGFALLAIVVEQALLVPLWQRMYGKPPSAWMESHLVVPARPVLAGALRTLHLRTMDEAARRLAPDALRPLDDTAARQLRDALLIEWLEALPESIDASALPTALARKRLVDRACELMLSQPDEPLSMLDVCRRLGTSRRKLNYCFQDVLGTTPVKYLRAVRLNGVRRELRGGHDTPVSVQEAAARWGFWHLGQFSRDYRQQFGELPSATLKAARLAPSQDAGTPPPLRLIPDP